MAGVALKMLDNPYTLRYDSIFTLC